MTEWSRDPVIRRLGQLAPIRPDPASDARTLSRCRAELSRQHRANRTDRARLSRGALVELTLAGVFTLAYVSAVVRDALVMFTAGH